MPGIKDAMCVLVIGATAGLGRSLALAIHDLETNLTVIVAGHRHERLDELAAKNGRIKTSLVDINTHHDNLKAFVQDILSQYPELDAVMLSSGIQYVFDFKKPETIDFKRQQNSTIDDELNTNYISIIKLITLLLPHFLKRGLQGKPSFIIPITSALALIPKVDVPNYSATKAALHSLDMSLRGQLMGTNIHVMEILPPLVESELHDHQGTTPALSDIWTLLGQFTKLTMEGLIRGDPDIAPGFAGTYFDKFEKGKREHVEQNIGKVSKAS